MYLLDANTIIYFFKRKGRVAERLLAKQPSEVGVPAPVLFELLTGAAKSQNPEKYAAELHAFMEDLRCVAFGAHEAAAAAGVRSDLESRGTPIGPMDTLIAGTALANGAVLVTSNVREFERIKGLRIENWY